MSTLRKLTALVASLVAATFAAAGPTWTTSCSYPNNQSNTDNDYYAVSGGVYFTGTMSGVGPTGGACFAMDTNTGVTYGGVNTGAGPGQSFYQTNTSYAYSSSVKSYLIYRHINTNGPGGYGTATVQASW